MKKLISFTTFMFLLLILVTSCNDENNPEEGSRLRITKMAYNEYLDYPSIFEYDSNNLLVKLTLSFEDGNNIYEIQYDAENKPVIVESKEYFHELIDEDTTYIQWTNDGYVMTYSNNNDYKNNIKLDSQGRVIGSDDDIFTWYGNDSLTVLYTPSNSISRFKFNNYKHPWSGINYAVIDAVSMQLAEWEKEWQYNYCIDEYYEDSFTIKVRYTVNEQNYPTLMEVRYLTDDEDLENEYMSFEYESY